MFIKWEPSQYFILQVLGPDFIGDPGCLSEEALKELGQLRDHMCCHLEEDLRKAGGYPDDYNNNKHLAAYLHPNAVALRLINHNPDFPIIEREILACWKLIGEMGEGRRQQDAIAALLAEMHGIQRAHNIAESCQVIDSVAVEDFSSCSTDSKNRILGLLEPAFGLHLEMPNGDRVADIIQPPQVSENPVVEKLSAADMKESDARISAGIQYFKNIVDRDCAISLESIKGKLQDAVIISGHPLEAYRNVPAPYLRENILAWKQGQLGGLMPGDVNFAMLMFHIKNAHTLYRDLCAILEIRDLDANERQAHFNVTNVLYQMLGQLHPKAIRQDPQLNAMAGAVNYRIRDTWRCPTTQEPLAESVSIQSLLGFMLPFVVMTRDFLLLQYRDIEDVYQDGRYQDFIHFVEQDLQIDLRDQVYLNRLREAVFPLVHAFLRVQELGGIAHLLSIEKTIIGGFEEWQIRRLLNDFLPPQNVLHLIMGENPHAAEIRAEQEHLEEELRLKKEAEEESFLAAQRNRPQRLLNVYSQLRIPAAAPQAPVMLSRQQFGNVRHNLRGSFDAELREFWAHLGTKSVPHPRDPEHLMSLSSTELRAKYVRMCPDEAYALYRAWKMGQNAEPQAANNPRP